MPDFATFISVLTRLISFPTLTQALGLGSKPPLAKAEDEFPPAPKIDSFQFRKQQGTRVYNIATSRIVQPRFVAFFGLSLSTVFGIGFVEAAHLCQEIPFIESFEAGKYCVL